MRDGHVNVCILTKLSKHLCSPLIYIVTCKNKMKYIKRKGMKDDLHINGCTFSLNLKQRLGKTWK